jgi:hypothetical protein
MPVIDWTDPADALALVQARAPFASADEAETLLDLSKGTDADGDDVYRPYVVLAHLFSTQWNAYVSLRGASGAALEYSDPGDAVNAYLQQQARVDASLDLEVPAAWPADAGSAVVATW